MRKLLLTLVLTSPAYADALALPAGFTTQESSIGQTVTIGDLTQYNPKVGKTPGVRVLADFRGMSLYTFDGDKPGASACTGACLREWMPLAAPLMATPKGDWSTFRRADGSPQWAYKGRPLYTFVKDAKAGDANGEGLAGQWHAVRL